MRCGINCGQTPMPIDPAARHVKKRRHCFDSIVFFQITKKKYRRIVKLQTLSLLTMFVLICLDFLLVAEVRPSLCARHE
jgi:uncharacterized membrane protein